MAGSSDGAAYSSAVRGGKSISSSWPGAAAGAQLWGAVLMVCTLPVMGVLVYESLTHREHCLLLASYISRDSSLNHPGAHLTLSRKKLLSLALLG